jgi:hypothetical protein
MGDAEHCAALGRLADLVFIARCTALGIDPARAVTAPIIAIVIAEEEFKVRVNRAIEGWQRREGWVAGGSTPQRSFTGGTD